MQNLKYIITSIIFTTILVACDKYDFQGFFVSPSKEHVNERFEQSIAYNELHKNDTLIVTSDVNKTQPTGGRVITTIPQKPVLRKLEFLAIPCKKCYIRDIQPKRRRAP